MAVKAHSLDQNHSRHHNGHGCHRKSLRLSSHPPDIFPQHPECKRGCQKQAVQIRHGIVIASYGEHRHRQQDNQRQQPVPPEKTAVSDTYDTADKHKVQKEHSPFIDAAVIIIGKGKHPPAPKQPDQHRNAQAVYNLSRCVKTFGKNMEKNPARQHTHGNYHQPHHGFTIGRENRGNHGKRRIALIRRRIPGQAAEHSEIGPRAILDAYDKENTKEARQKARHTKACLFPHLLRAFTAKLSIEKYSNNQKRFRNIRSAHHHIQPQTNARPDEQARACSR